MTSEQERKVWAVILSLAIFVVGAVVGVALDRMVWCQKDQGWLSRKQPEALVEHFERELDLSEEQTRAVTQILVQRWRETSRIFKQVDPEADAIRQRSHNEIRAVLTDKQRVKFEKMVEEHEARRKEMRKRFESPN